MKAIINNYFNIEENNKVYHLIETDDLNMININNLFNEIRVLKGENPYNIEEGLTLDYIINKDLNNLLVEVKAILDKYDFLGQIDFTILEDIETECYNLYIAILLNEPIIINNKEHTIIRQQTTLGV